MPDYIVSISASSQMMIRDTGGWVEFWFHTGPQSWNNDQQYSFGANNSGSGIREFRLLRGGHWQHFDSVYVSYDQTVSFTVYGAGIGFPTYTFYQHIQRSTVPQPPTMRSATPISSSAFHVWFTGNYHGGTPVIEWQIGYGSSSNGPTSLVGWSDGTTDVGGFTSGQRVYFWARGRNSLGWSAWSNRVEGVTWQVPAAPGQPTFWNVTQVSAGVSYNFTTRASDPPILEKQFRYGRDPTAAVIDGTVNINEPTEYIYGLDPGKSYYFWARARNSVGWGPWSASTKLNLIAGSRVLVAGVWKRAVPYLNVGGVWKVAEPWIKEAGVWKKTSI
jgi:hypothetical protein